MIRFYASKKIWIDSTVIRTSFGEGRRSSPSFRDCFFSFRGISRKAPSCSHPALLFMFALIGLYWYTLFIYSLSFVSGWEHSAWSLWHSWGFGTEVLWRLRPAWKGRCHKHGPNPGKAAEEAASHGSEYFHKPNFLIYELTFKKDWLLVKGDTCKVLVQNCSLCSPSRYNVGRGTTGAGGTSPCPKGGQLVVERRADSPLSWLNSSLESLSRLQAVVTETCSLRLACIKCFCIERFYTPFSFLKLYYCPLLLSKSRRGKPSKAFVAFYKRTWSVWGGNRQIWSSLALLRN